MPDAIKLLEADHREVEDLFAKAESTSGAAKSQVVGKLCDELTVHAQVEEEVVYPAMREAGLNDLVDEAEKEHRAVKELIGRLKEIDSASGDADPIVAMLKADVSHHVSEEESEAFPRFRSAINQGALDELGSQLARAKEDAKAALG